MITKLIIATALIFLTFNFAVASTLTCKTSISQGEGEKVLDSQQVEIVNDPMVMADISLQSQYGYMLAAEVRADRVKIYAQGNGIMLAAQGQNLAELNMGKANFTEGFVVNCEIK